MGQLMAQDARQDDEKAALRRAQILGLSYYDSSFPQKVIYKDLLTLQELYQLKVIPLQKAEHFIHFGVTNTTSRQSMDMLKHRFLDQQVNFSLISDTGYREYMKLYDPPKKIEYTDIQVTSSANLDQVDEISGILSQVKANDMLAYLVQQAHKLNASDIHVEPQKDYVRIRFRIDGVLHVIAKLGFDKYRVLLSAIAAAGNIYTSGDEAQQGHIAQELTMVDGASVSVNLRLETVPSVNGVEIVMRLFNMSSEMYNLDRLMLSVKERTVVDDIISKPSGLVMVVGPTGSGKTTTLYSMLNSLNSDERKIITLEDPVEYQFPGISQLPINTINTEVTFADRLKAVLRLDPDIIMVGEIRDLETAKTALQASLTGHLVLCTFHASSAAAALTRLADIIGDNPLFLSAIRLVMAQRLVRRLDDSTKQAFTPDQTTLDKMKHALVGLPEEDFPKFPNGVELYNAVPGPDNPYGFKGQLPLREQFLMTGELRKLLENGGKNITTQSIEEAAVNSGMRTMYQDGLIKVLRGETTLEEIARVVG
ncbi:MAG: Flp pilus assembly complex ATPase component TadA [bacterium]|nr:Flp pilus assembly complex ATPase component TadA [bacterium]